MDIKQSITSTYTIEQVIEIIRSHAFGNLPGGFKSPSCRPEDITATPLNITVTWKNSKL